MTLDTLIDSIIHRFKRSKAQYAKEKQQLPFTSDHDRGHGGPAGRSSQHIYGPFSNASDFILRDATFLEIGNYIHTTILSKSAVLELLQPYTRPDAAMDSSARYPPPTCHPKTRLSLRYKLKHWLYDSKRQCRMMWVYGPAGTGKSAVAQTFAEDCAGWGKLGAAYFFSKTEKRNKFETVIPSLAHQLAVAFPDYKSLISTEFSNNPDLLHKAPPVQFRKLVIEPFSTLQRQRRQEPIVIILDGLDECEGEDAQLKIIDMVAEAIRLNPDLPLLWLICSRPEVHLKLAFARVADCSREELIIDTECRSDVERYLRDKIEEIKAKYIDITPPDWPSSDQLKRLFDAVSGLFVLASTILNYIEDRTYADPVGQLDDLMTFLETARAVGSRNPLAALDLLYMRILGDIPHRVFPTTWRIVAHFIHIPLFFAFSAQVLCNVLRLNQHTFYKALRALHSVIEIPEPEDATDVPCRFHHKSFQDFLVDPNRSGKFVIEEQKARVDIAKSTLFWYDIDSRLFHNNDGRGYNYDTSHKHNCLPGLTWASRDNGQHISKLIAEYVRIHCWWTVARLSWANVDEVFLSRIYDFDFRYGNAGVLTYLANWFYKHDPSNTFARTEPLSPTDFRLLEYFNIVIGNGAAEPAPFPVEWPRYQPRRRQYFFIGRGVKSVIVWFTGTKRDNVIWMLTSDREPSAAQISQYEKDLKDIGWSKDYARTRLEGRTH